MKLGLISDIHSDFPSLQVSLALLEREGVDQIVCMGDVVESLRPGGNEVINRLRVQDIPSVMGNHDLYAVERESWLYQTDKAGESGVREYILTQENLLYLKDFPLERRFVWEGRQVVLSHGHLWPTQPFSPAGHFEKAIAEYKAETLLVGHTHRPLQAKIGQSWIFNPGAVSEYSSHTCAILSLPECTFRAFDLESGQEIEATRRDITTILSTE
jgi:putative phosphoesterase